MMWLFYTLFELFVWSCSIRELLTSNPILHLMSSALNDVIWIPLAIALPVYITALFSRLVQRYVVREMVVFVLACFFIVALANPHFYFRIIWLLTILFIVLWIAEVWHLRRLRISLVFFSIALAGLLVKYNMQLLPQWPHSSPDDLTLMSFNMNTQMPMDDQRTVQFIRESMPDIIMLQEFSAHEKKYILSSLQTLYPYQLLPGRKCGKNDVMILSRKEILQGEQVKLKTPYSKNFDTANHAVIVYQGEKINVLNCHLTHPVRFLPKLFAAPDSSVKYFDALKRADLQHREEARILSAYIRGLDGPVILAGDFNDTPNSFVYHQFSPFYQNAFASAGYGLGATFGEWTLQQALPTALRAIAFDCLRIDHVFCSRDFKISKAVVAPLDAFDHRPQLVSIRLLK